MCVRNLTLPAGYLKGKGYTVTVKRLTLRDIALDSDALAERLVITRLRIIGVFRRATEPDPRRYVLYKGTQRHAGAVRGSDNAIVTCGDGKISTLASHVWKELQARTPVLELGDISPESVRRIKPKLLASELNRLQHELIAHVLCEMRDAYQIYFMDGSGIWQAHQSVVDEYMMWRESAQQMRQEESFVNARPFHGRVRSQALRRGTPPGTSIGTSKQGRRMTG